MLIGLLRSSKLRKLPSMFSQALIIMTCILLFNSCTLIPSSQPFNLFILKSDINRQYWFGLAWIWTSACIGSKKPNTLYPLFCRTSVNRLHKSSSSSTITIDFNIWLGLLSSSLTVDIHQTHHEWYTSNTWYISAYKVLKLIILLWDFKILILYLLKITFFNSSSHNECFDITWLTIVSSARGVLIRHLTVTFSGSLKSFSE